MFGFAWLKSNGALEEEYGKEAVGGYERATDLDEGEVRQSEERATA